MKHTVEIEIDEDDVSEFLEYCTDQEILDILENAGKEHLIFRAKTVEDELKIQDFRQQNNL